MTGGALLCVGAGPGPGGCGIVGGCRGGIRFPALILAAGTLGRGKPPDPEPAAGSKLTGGKAAGGKVLESSRLSSSPLQVIINTWPTKDEKTNSHDHIDYYFI